MPGDSWKQKFCSFSLALTGVGNEALEIDHQILRKSRQQFATWTYLGTTYSDECNSDKFKWEICTLIAALV